MPCHLTFKKLSHHDLKNFNDQSIFSIFLFVGLTVLSYFFLGGMTLKKDEGGRARMWREAPCRTAAKDEG